MTISLREYSLRGPPSFSKMWMTTTPPPPPPSCGWTIVDDSLNVADIFNLTNEVMNMTLREHIYPKSVWKNIVWERGWSLEDTHWCLEAKLHKELDLLTLINPNSRYLTWWSLSNTFPEMIHFCEVRCPFSFKF